VRYKVTDKIYSRFNRKIGAKRGELGIDELNVLEKIKLWMIKPRNIVILVLFVIGPIVAGYLSGYWSVTASLILIAFLYIATITFVFVLYKVTDKIYSRFNRKISAKRSELGIDELDKSIEKAKQTVDKAVIEKGILPELRWIINLHIPSYDTSLKELEAPGLAEVFDPAYEIPTKSKEKLQNRLKSMPGGSIGIAGPRGAGKTTLLRSFCAEDVVYKINNRPVLSVLTSAPVEYEARDFILHLFALVCKRVLKLKGESIEAPLRYIDTLRKTFRKNPFTHLLFGTPKNGLIFSLIGLFLIVLSLIIPRKLLAEGTQMVTHPVAIFGIIFTFFGLLWLFRVPNRIKRRFELSELYEDKHRFRGISGKAQRRLHEIKYQQSYSSGWSGSLKLPIAVEGGVNAATSLSLNPLSFPEIIESYLDFKKDVTKEYVVVIGIDELDKLKSDEIAHRFLNEIKAIFGVKNCFYLISVSESAMSTFERRGLPFRNVFDSSFDDIIYVNYLSSESAENLIKRRVIGMPIPFVYFCYCMSGGLARDLIRTCRDLLELVRVAPTENSFSTLCSSLIRADMKSKLRAISITAKDIKLEPDMTQLLEEVHQLETALPPSHSLLKDWSDLLCGIKQRSAREHRGSEEVLVECEKLASLRDELGAYLYYSLTLEDFFNEDIDVEIFKGAEGKDACKQLARARQSLVFSPNLARSLITDFRISQNMDIPPTPNEKTMS
jgi:hypothetical protein